MRKFFNNRFVRALGLLMLFSAIVHMILLIVHAIKVKDLNHLNFFDILELDRYFPGIIQGRYSLVIASVCMIVIYVTFYLVLKKR